MKKKQNHNLLRLLLVLIFLLTALISVAVGKYVTTSPHNGTVSFKAYLATSIEIWEHPYTDVDKNGEYELLTESDPIETSGVSQSYILIPGVDVLKDSYVKIVGKTEIPAYLYVTVTTTNQEVSWEMDAHWKLQDGAYIYCDPDTKAPIEITSDMDAINIFAGKVIRVSDKLLGSRNSDLTITAFLRQVQ